MEALFAEFEDADDDEQSSLAERICNMLTVHAQIEEEILYPAAKEALSEDEEEAELVNEAEVEHASAKELIAKIEGMTPDDEAFKATVKVLGEYVKHHVKEEENELFPALKESELDLKEIGSTTRGAQVRTDGPDGSRGTGDSDATQAFNGLAFQEPIARSTGARRRP